MKEPLELQLNLTPTYWADAPNVRVTLDEIEIFNGVLSAAQTIKWAGDLDNGSHNLNIALYGKNKYQTILENGEIIKDQLVKIDEILFDDVEIGGLKWSLSSYIPSKEMQPDAPDIVPKCANLGYNGTWTLPFTTPIYIWLLENL